ncbi:MAG: hypothetical protein ACXQT2_04440 [Methanotrichaceae archaeon]
MSRVSSAILGFCLRATWFLEDVVDFLVGRVLGRWDVADRFYPSSFFEDLCMRLEAGGRAQG